MKVKATLQIFQELFAVPWKKSSLKKKPEIVENAKRQAKKILHEVKLLERRKKQLGSARQGKRGDAE